jgi:hypothetical protein
VFREIGDSLQGDITYNLLKKMKKIENWIIKNENKLWTIMMLSMGFVMGFVFGSIIFNR